MSRLQAVQDECVILVKALPHRSSNYFETVCCAGIGHDMKWRRLYPVAFRTLDSDQQFKRWSWVSYRYVQPKSDARVESQKVDHTSIQVGPAMRASERSRIARQLTLESTEEAAARGQSLTLLEPSDIRMSWKRKSDAQVAEERIKHAELAGQLSFLHDPPKPLEPCPFEFSFRWRDAQGRDRSNICDDWETSTAFFVRRRSLGETAALASLRETYEVEYPSKGVRLALGTHSRRQSQWLLVGIIRVDDHAQGELLL